MNLIKKKWLINTFSTILIVAVLIAAFIGLNLWVQQLNVPSIDVTKNKLYSLSDASKNEIKNIDEDVTIYLFGYDEGTSVVDLAKQYTSVNPRIKCEVTTVADRPELKETYGLTSDTQAIVVQAKERNKAISPYELYSYDSTSSDSVDLTEQKLTNAILDTTIDEKPVVYFMSGHGEYLPDNGMQMFATYLENEVNTVKTIDIMSNGAVPEDCSVLIIASPTKDIAENEASILTDYINKGGKILWFSDPILTGTEFPNLQKVLDLFGITLSNGIVAETDASKMFMSSPNLIIPTLNSSNKITKDLATDGGIMLLNSGKLNIAEDSKLEELGIESENLVTSGSTSFFRTDTSKSLKVTSDDDEKGPFTIGASMTKKINDATSAKLVIYSSNIFVSDTAITVNNQNIYAISLYNNKDIALNSIAYLTDRDDTITVRKNVGTVNYTATQQQNLIIMAIIFAVPLLIILVGIIVWQVRRRKK